MNLTIYNFNGTDIAQHPEDGYMDATAMCQANGKLFADYQRLGTTQEFLQELSRSMGIPIDLLIRRISTGKNEDRGTWVHPLVANNLGQWCSAPFAVFVAILVYEWRKAGQPDFRQPQSPSSCADREFLVGHKAILQQKRAELKQTLAQVKLAEIELERDRLKFQHQPAPAEPFTVATEPTPETVVVSSPRRRAVATLQKQTTEPPMRASYQRILAVLNPYEAIDAAEVAELIGTTPCYARASLVKLWRKKLVHRSLADPGKANGRYVYYKVETVAR